MKQKSTSMHPVLRAQVRAKWASTSVNAQIHALFGDNKDKLLAYSSILMFVASACATQLDMAQDNIKFRVIRGAINALDDLKDKQTITQVDRGSIYAGLLASQELIEDTAIEIVDDAAQMYYRMEQQMGMA
jgi:response regulator RpfG family c-di-GMP phosphodiesterase